MFSEFFFDYPFDTLLDNYRRVLDLGERVLARNTNDNQTASHSPMVRQSMSMETSSRSYPDGSSVEKTSKYLNGVGYTKTVRKDKDGSCETTHHYHNMKTEDMDEFEHIWSNQQRHPTLTESKHKAIKDHDDHVKLDEKETLDLTDKNNDKKNDTCHKDEASSKQETLLDRIGKSQPKDDFFGSSYEDE